MKWFLILVTLHHSHYEKICPYPDHAQCTQAARELNYGVGWTRRGYSMTAYTRVKWAIVTAQVPVMLGVGIASHYGHVVAAFGVSCGMMGFWAGIMLGEIGRD